MVPLYAPRLPSHVSFTMKKQYKKQSGIRYPDVHLAHVQSGGCRGAGGVVDGGERVGVGVPEQET